MTKELIQRIESLKKYREKLQRDHTAHGNTLPRLGIDVQIESLELELLKEEEN